MELSKIIKKQILKSFLLSIILSVFGFLILNFVNSYKFETVIYLNEKYFKEINEDTKYLLSSMDYLKYMKNNSKLLEKTMPNKELYSLSKEMLLEKSGQDTVIKFTFFTKDKESGIEFVDEYIGLANNYLLSYKNKYFSSQVEILNRQYNELNNKTNILEYRDALADSTISKLVSYKQYLEDDSPIVKVNTYKIKNKFNKKIIVLLFFCLGFVLPILFEIYKKEYM